MLPQVIAWSSQDLECSRQVHVLIHADIIVHKRRLIPCVDQKVIGDACMQVHLSITCRLQAICITIAAHCLCKGRCQYCISGKADASAWEQGTHDRVVGADLSCKADVAVVTSAAHLSTCRLSSADALQQFCAFRPQKLSGNSMAMWVMPW